MSATTRALFLQDIFGLIIEELYPGPQIPSHRYSQVLMKPLHSDRRKCQATLARLAQACRTFRDPALKVLWRYVDNVFYLLDVNPSCYHIAETDYRFNVSIPFLHVFQYCG